MESVIGYEAVQGYNCSFKKCINCNRELGGGGESFHQMLLRYIYKATSSKRSGHCIF